MGKNGDNNGVRQNICIPAPVPVPAIVLAGGQSRRMGCNKAFVAAGPGNEGMLDRAVRVCRKAAGFALVASPAGIVYEGHACLEDDRADLGPISGLLNALGLAARLGFPAVLILACDMPLMRASTLSALIRAHLGRADFPLATIYQNWRTGKLEMLAAVYSIAAFPPVQAAYRAGRGALRQILPAGRIQRLVYGPTLAPDFFNCNTPGDLACLGVARS